jgi:NAD(P)-dependent dehydrogenase (short-subunit alcohol dehydrogenase family)
MKTMLVTGASSGVGWALAVRAARAGFAVYAVGRNIGALEALAAKIIAEAGFVEVAAVDISVPANARGLIARTLERFGSIDVLVNNAGLVCAGPLAEQSDDQLVRQFGTHVIGPVALVREALPALRAARGIVFMLGSGVARVPVGGLGAYPPAKAAIRSASTILRRELAAQGVALTYVDPGAIDTPFMKRAGMPGAPAPLLISPETVARKILIAVGDRPRELNAVGWQTALVALAERFPRLTDTLLARAPGLIGGAAPPAEVPSAGADAQTAGVELERIAASEPAAIVDAAATQAHIADGDAPDEGAAIPAPAGADPPVDSAAIPEPAQAGEAPSAFEVALEPHRRRMEKLNLRETFVRELLIADAQLDAGEIALRWAGMPNKNERAITDDVLEALADAGFLERGDARVYRVVRKP